MSTVVGNEAREQQSAFALDFVGLNFVVIKVREVVDVVCHATDVKYRQ